jgi:hypothetical protein
MSPDPDTVRLVYADRLVYAERAGRRRPTVPVMALP